MARALVLCLLTSFTVVSLSRAQDSEASAPSAQTPSGSHGTTANDPPEPEQEPGAETLRAAIAAYEAGDMQLAQALFEALHRDSPSARTLRGLGVVAYRRGRFVAAAQLLEQSLLSTSRPLIEEMRQSVEVLLRDANSRVARLDLVVTPSEAVVQIEGQAVVRDASGALLLLPGNHTVEVSAVGRASAKLVVSGVAGGSQRVMLELQALPNPPQVPAVGLPEAGPSPSAPSVLAQPAARPDVAPPSRRALRLKRTAYGLMGVGAAALVTSGVATLLGMKRINDIEDLCKQQEPDGRCTTSMARSQEREKNTELLSVLSIGGAVLGAVSGGLGAGLLLTVHRQQAAERVPARGAELSIRVAF